MKRVFSVTMICLLLAGAYAQQPLQKANVVNKEQSNVEAKKSITPADFSAKTGALQATERVQKSIDRTLKPVNGTQKLLKRAEQNGTNRQLPRMQNLNLSNAAKSAPVFLQDFEGSTTNCSFVGGDCPWAIGTDFDCAFSDNAVSSNGTNYAFIDDDDCNGNLSDAWFKISGINLSTVANPVLSFKTLYFVGSGAYRDELKIKVSIDGEISWTDVQILPEIPMYVDDYEGYIDWTQLTYALVGCANQANVSIAFHFNDCGTWAYAWCVDDIAIYDFSTSNFCWWTLEGEDYYEDSWNFGYLEVVQEGITTFLATCAGSSVTFTFPVWAGTVDFVWHEGDYDDEVGFTVYDHNQAPTSASIAMGYEPFDGETWSVISNCVIPSDDASIIAITAPVSGINLTATETVTATIKNEGLNTIVASNLQLELTVDGTVIAPNEPYTGSNIAAGATANYTFTATANLFANGQHTITVRAILGSDGNTDNDSLTVTVTNTVCPSVALPLTQNFEDNSYLCWTMISNNTENGLGGTGYSPMGVYDVDANKIFRFSSWTSTGVTDYNQYLITPELPATTNPLNISFDYYVYSGYTAETFRIGYSSATSAFSDFNWESEITANNTSTNILSYSGSAPAGTKYIAINYTSPSSRYLLYIDNILIKEAAANDAAVIDITSPVSGINLTGTETVTVTIKNFGSDPITSLPLILVVDSEAPIYETYTNSTGLLTGATDTYTFSQTVDLRAEGLHTITVTSDLSTDGDTDNDSHTITVINIHCPSVVSLPLTQNFEDNSYVCWTVISNNTENGPGGTGSNPMGLYYTDDSHTNIAFAFSSYTTASDYNQYLITPELPVTTNALNITFDYASARTNVEKFRVGHSSTTNAISAFTWGDEETANNELPDFLSYSGSVPAGTKYIAIHYYSSYQYLLFIDNIVIDEAAANVADAAITAITSPVSGENLTNAETVTVTIKNEGNTPITSLPLILVVDNGASINAIYANSTGLQANETASYTFIETVDLSAEGSHTITVTADLSNDNNTANNSKTITVVNTHTAIADNTLPNVSIYPNPANSKLTIDNMEGQFNTIEVTNTLGQVIYRASVTGNQATAVDVTAYSTGMYYVKLQGVNGMVTKKFVKK